MNLTLTRTAYRSDGIFGMLTKDDGTELAVTLEHAFPGTQAMAAFVPKVAAGVYTCIRHAPNRLPYVTFELQNVPDFQGKSVTGILIHILNYNADSDGCVGVGRRIVPSDKNPSEQMITSSENTFNMIMDLQRGVDEFQLTVKDKA